MAAKNAAVQIEVGERSVRLSSPDRVLWPEVGLTKKDLAEYVVAVGPALLRAIGDRPVSLERFPEGVDGERFYSKNPPRGVPDYARSVKVTYPSGRSHPQLVVDEVATAVWAVQMNTLTLHPWPVRTANTDNPDELRLDLDPQPGRDYADAVQAALQLRDLLKELGLTGYVKSSGNRGVHVFTPIRPEHEFLDVRHAAIGIGRELERRAPDLVTMAWWKEERGERIFVDFNQCTRDRTMAGAYSPRPLPHAPVSTPLSWDELPEVDPKTLTVRTVPQLLADRGDPWEGMHESAGDIAPALELWRQDVEERGLGELPFPPDYPKMPGEPKRARPSVSRADTEGIADRDWYADPKRWDGDKPKE
ncbi:non-homologous end-joining DNA ligase [Kineosporia rhizophila]|uniref:non-homologous end-joining DNA ligase n=1 Tax=Kineosporia TaxID=49184 RepID=UPI001E455648|nr:non-homologous end-joining DNA ligase [Kineosporia sp. NBRC 101677]MCE0536792.1 non-homologous end-joining DNA ligase [Kineosporia rhizophila]GLY13059.1 ATP-dependent DNA ligase [Kineosporia sp. NBRC 101677]